MYDDMDYIKYLMEKIDFNHNEGDFLEERIYQDCLDKFRIMLKNKKQLSLYKRKRS